MAQNQKIYSACYSNNPVYEYNVGPGAHIMRRRADDWINATHILKAAAYDKPTRTRILEREVQKGVHEKVQGGYGKYQGTWIPLPDGRALAERNGILEKLLPIFDYVPGDRSPPPAPKHATAAANRPRAPKQTAAARRMPVASKRSGTIADGAGVDLVAAVQLAEEQHYDRANMTQYPEEDTPDNVTIASESMMDADDPYAQFTGSRKRKRGVDQISLQDQQHQIWADSLLDYFMLLESEERFASPPDPPPGINLDRPIDDKGHSALHWAAAMGDIDVTNELIARHARIDCLSNNLETPLMRAVMFTNNFDKQTMPRLVRMLAPTVQRTDWFGSTVFHHIAATTSSRNKYKCARYYIDTIVNFLAETWIPDEITRLLNATDQNGDTCVMIAARNGARKCVRTLLGRNVQVDRPNVNGQTADDLIRELNARRKQHLGRNGGRELSSSPFASDVRGMNGDISLSRISLTDSALINQHQPQYRSQTANSIANRLLPNIQERLAGLAQAFEQEYDAKAEEELEIDRVLQKRTSELEYLRKQLAEVQSLEAHMRPDERARQDEELRQLEVEAEALLEVEQASELASLIQNNTRMAAPNTINGSADQRALLSKLAAAQQDRRRLASTIVQALGNAGIGERQEGYKRLIRGAIGVKENEIEGMLDEVLKELEEEARERGADYVEAAT